MKRVLIKLSGEALGKDGKLFDYQRFDEMAHSLKTIADSGTQTAVVFGGGNLWRGRRGDAKRVNPVIADQMGMTGTLMNALLMQDSLTRIGAKAKTFCAFDAPRFADPYTQRSAEAALSNNHILLFAGGTGHPFFSTDTGAALRAIELNVDSILLAKNVDGVYDKDPNQHPDAKLLPQLTYTDAINQNLQVMDLAALVLCRDNNIPMLRVFDLKEPNGLIRAANGETGFGSVVTP